VTCGDSYVSIYHVLIPCGYFILTLGITKREREREMGRIGEE
jgi:hypothetical protein